MLALRRSLALLTVPAVLAVAPVAFAQSPFAPGGPLEPWSGPLPNPPAASVSSQAPPTAFYAPAPTVESAASDANPSPPTQFAAFPHRRFGESLAPVGENEWRPGLGPSAPPAADDHASPPLDPDEDRQTYVVATVNPALMTFGKTSARLEIAPLAAHAVFLEVSRLSFYVDDASRTVTGTEFDVGYHLFPQGKGAYGFYIGPRYMFGSGDIPEASWEFQGIGGDLGYQWIIANHLVFNLGAGVARVEGKAQIDDSLASSLLDGVPADQADSFRSLSTQSQTLWVPMVTLGFGLAI